MAEITMGGAALEFLQRKYGGRFEERESRPAVSVAAASVVPNNPDRLALLVINTSAVTVTLGLANPLTAGLGIELAASGGSMALDVEEDATLVTREWLGVVGAGVGSLYVLEINRPIALSEAKGGRA